MTTQKDILDFISKNSEEKIQDYFNKLYEKQKELNQRINKLSIYFILTALVFFLLSFTNDANIHIGPITISNNSIIYKLIPLFFSYISLEFAIASNHKGDLMKLLKTFSLHIYKQNIHDGYFKDAHHLNFFTRLVLPFSFWSDLSNVLSNKKGMGSGCILVLLFLPAGVIYILPFYFEFICIKFLIINYWSDWISKISVIISVWLILITIYFYSQVMTQNRAMLKEEGRL